MYEFLLFYYSRIWFYSRLVNNYSSWFTFKWILKRVINKIHTHSKIFSTFSHRSDYLIIHIGCLAGNCTEKNLNIWQWFNVLIFSNKIKNFFQFWNVFFMKILTSKNVCHLNWSYCKIFYLNSTVNLLFINVKRSGKYIFIIIHKFNLIKTFVVLKLFLIA